MAKFRPLLGELSGSIGDNTWSHNKGGPYVRRRAIPTNPNSVRQQAARAILTTLSSSWAGLSSTNRAQWESWAASNPVVNTLGESIQLTGQQAYVALNSRVLGFGGVASATPPIFLAPVALASMTVTCVAGAISVVFTPTPLPANLALAIWHTPPGSVGQSPNQKQARLAGYTAAAPVSPGATTAWVTPLAGQQIQVYVSVMNSVTGMISQALRQAVVCT